MSWQKPKMRTLFSRSKAPSAIFLFAALGVTNTALADNFYSTRSDKLVEKSHKIEIRVGHGHADLLVRRTAHNGGPRHDQATFYIDMPEGAVAVGLRTLGMLDGKAHWFEGELLEAEAAAARYRELTGIGGYYPKDPALLSWRSQSMLALQVFPCSPGEDKTIEYTLRMPTHYHDGRWHLNLNHMGTETLAADASIVPMEPGDALYVAEKPVRSPAWATLKDEIDISVAAANAEGVTGALATLPASKQKNINQFHFEAAPRLGRVPHNAHVVVLLDASRSLEDGELRAEIAMTKAYLSHYTDGKAAIVPFDRAAHVPKEGFSAMAAARASLGQLTIEQKNGSHVDEALKTADAMLAKLPATTPKRIVLITDGRTRKTLTPEMLRGTLQKSGALLHIGVIVNTNTTEIGRDDEHPWSIVTRPTGGLVWNAAMDEGSDLAMQKQIFEEWARPKRIDHLTVRPQGIETTAVSFQDTLIEGEGLEDSRISEKPISYVEIAGELWSTPMKRVLVPNEAENQRFAGLVFGTSLMYELSEAEMMPLAMLGKAVSPVTSYLAIEPGVRPSTEGLDEMSGTGVGFGSGSGRLFGSHMAGQPRMRGIDKEAFLRQALRAGLDTCGGRDQKAEVVLESTLAELCAIKVNVDNEKQNSKISACFEEAAWAIELPGVFDLAHEDFTIRL